MKKILAGLVALAILAAGGWYFASPTLALKGLKEAAQEGNADQLRERVDFPAVRESLRSQMHARLAPELTKDDDNPLGKMGALFAMGMLDGMIEGLVTPESISAIVLQRKKNPLAKNDTEKGAAGRARSPDWAIERHGFNEFRLVGKDKTGAPAPDLIFKRHGLGWELVGIDLSKVDLSWPAR